jgi:hypothetical protein
MVWAMESVTAAPTGAWTHDFARPPSELGWAIEANREGVTPDGAWQPASAETPPGLTVSRGRWRSPLLATRPFQYVELRLRLRVTGRVYWALRHRTAAGELLTADHYSCVDTTAGWADYQACGRVPADAVGTELIIEPAEGSACHLASAGLGPATAATAWAWMQRLQRALPPFAFTPPAERWARLPRTAASRAARAPLSVVMLGDSIVNDTANALFEAGLAVDLGWPWQVVSSVRGSTGCPYYQEPAHFANHVARFRPDLLIIGGISHGGDLAALRSVLHQAALAGCPEVLLLTPGIHRGDPRERGDATVRERGHHAEFVARLATLAEAEGVAYFDLEGAVADYLRQHPALDINGFRRDVIHANDQGRAVYAALLHAWFVRP